MSDWRQVRKLLCVRLDAFGDVLMTEPALRALHQSLPLCRLSLLTSRAGAQAAAMIPFLDEVVVYEAPWMASRDPSKAVASFDFIRHLRAQRFDAAIIFTVYSQNPLPAAVLCHLAGIPLCTAFCRENPYFLLSDWLPEQEPHACTRHEVERQLALVATLGASVDDAAMRISLPDSARTHAESIWRNAAHHGAARIVVHPGASAASRRYPAERFAAAMKRIHASTHASFLVTGNAGEQALAAAVVEQCGFPGLSLAGCLDTGEWAALIASADLLIANNTGAAHIAAATQTPVVDLYAQTNPQHTPWRVPAKVLSHDVPCKNCYNSVCPEEHHLCLLGVDPDQVALAALDLLRSSSVPSPMPAIEALTCSAAG